MQFVIPRGQKVLKNLFEEIMTANFLTLGKEMDTRMQEAHWAPTRIK